MKKTDFAEAHSIKLSWPTPQDYNEALQHPDTSFSDPELKIGKVGLNKLGLPRPMTGNFASVYYMDCPQKDYAIRCFLHNISDQKERYDKISKYLNDIALPILADSDYFDDGILVHGRWYPMLRMDWVDGQNLIEFIGRNLDNAKALEKLRLWLRDARKTLSDRGIAHGDLQHGNVLVTNKDIKLVDYDGMFVPELQGLESNELGHRNYQHPARTRHDFGPHLDNFAAWLIDSCLYILQRDPRLWFDVNAGEDCLLFREKDLQDPMVSPVFHKLEGHANKEIQARAKMLRWFLTLPLDQIPDLDTTPEVPDVLPVLEAKNMKPDWLSSAQYLTAKTRSGNRRDYAKENEEFLRQRKKTYAWQWKGVNTAQTYQTSPSSTGPWTRYASSKKSGSENFIGILIILAIFSIIQSLSSHIDFPYSQPTPVSTQQQTQDAEQQLERTFDQGSDTYRLGNFQSAVGYFQKAYDILVYQQKQTSIEAANCLYWKARCEINLNRITDARTSLQQAEMIYRDHEGPQSRDVAKTYHAYGLVNMKDNNYWQAIDCFTQSIKIFKMQPGNAEREDNIADVSYALGWAYVSAKQPKLADQTFQRVIKYYDDQRLLEEPYVRQQLKELQRYYAKNHDTVQDIQDMLDSVKVP